MRKDAYKRVIGKLEPNEGFERRLAEKLMNKPSGLNVKPAAGLAACVIVVLCTVFLLFQHGTDKRHSPGLPSVTPSPTTADGAVDIPKLKLPRSSAKADMIGLIVYKGKIYTQTDTTIPSEYAKRLLGEKIGQTKGSIDEWSDQDDYASELASSIGRMDVYAVKGYDRNFRIMTYEERDGEIFAAYYECLNGIEVSSGADILSKLKIIGNIQAADWEEFEGWNNNKQEYHQLQVDETVQTFLRSLNAAKPIEQEKLQSAGIFDDGEQRQKFVLMKLKDHSVVRLRLFKDGYVMYGYTHVFFKVDAAVFDELWNRLK